MEKIKFSKNDKADEVKLTEENDVVETTVETSAVEIVPGKKVGLKGRAGTFAISQITADGKVIVLGFNDLILKVKPEEIISI